MQLRNLLIKLLHIWCGRQDPQHLTAIGSICSEEHRTRVWLILPKGSLNEHFVKLYRTNVRRWHNRIMTEKKFANTHYPGIKADPNEGRQPLDPRAKEKHSSLLQEIGEDAFRFRLGVSLLITNLNGAALQEVLPLVRFAVAWGSGRVGVLGESVHDDVSTLQAVKAWILQEAPWVEFEPFARLSIDREMEDVTRGFDVCLEAGSKIENLEKGFEEILRNGKKPQSYPEQTSG